MSTTTIHESAECLFFRSTHFWFLWYSHCCFYI